MVALLNQLKDLLLCPEPPRTPVEKPERRGEAKGAGTSQHSYWEVLHSVTSCSHPGNHHSRSMGIAVPTQHHGGEEKEKEDTPLALVPHQRAHRGRRKGDGLKHHHQSFPLETRREGRREGGGLGHGELVNILQLLWLWRCWAAERRGRCSYKCFIIYEPIGNRRGAFVPFTPEGMRSSPPAGATLEVGQTDNPAGLHYKEPPVHGTSSSVSTQLRLHERAGDTNACCKRVWRCQGLLHGKGFGATANGGAHPREFSCPMPRGNVLPSGGWVEAGRWQAGLEGARQLPHMLGAGPCHLQGPPQELCHPRGVRARGQ